MKRSVKIEVLNSRDTFPFPGNAPIPRVGDFINPYNAYGKSLQVLNVFHKYSFTRPKVSIIIQLIKN